MEFCSKGSLYSLLKDEGGYLDWEKSLKMLEDITVGLLALHRHSPTILHRDLKTLNVLVTDQSGPELTCKLCDFGLSRFDTTSSAQTLLKCRGTYAYIAPEVYSQKGYFIQSDVYSVSIMIWEFVNRLITGEYKRPYQEIKMEFQILIQAHGPKVLRPEIPPTTPDCLKNLILQSWDPNYETRPTSEQLLVKLQNIKAEFLQNRSTWDALAKNKAERPVPKLHKTKQTRNLHVNNKDEV